MSTTGARRRVVQPPPSETKARINRLMKQSGLVCRIYARYLSRKKGLTREADWIRSYRETDSVDAEGNPLPWLTYSAIELLESRVHSGMNVFEYGCGNSTRWWAARVGRILSCESDGAWADRIRPTLPANAEIRMVDLDREGVEAYAATIDAYPSSFDIVVVDGHLDTRLACAEHAVRALKPDGVIIWDNSDFEWDRSGFEELRRQGFRQLDLGGMGPINHFTWLTAIMYRIPNVLQLNENGA